jgi:predicted metal-dependent hydrolase
MAQSKRKIALEHRQLEYTLRKRRGQRTIALSVHSDGRVTLTAPKWVTLREIERFLVEKTEWLLLVTRNLPQHSHKTLEIQKNHYKKNKEAARTLIKERLLELNTHYGFAYRRISIRSNTSRWGSCSQMGNLNFDYRLLFLTPHLRDYVLIHELCHLREMNHGARFWKLVEQTVPEYKKHRGELSKVKR